MASIGAASAVSTAIPEDPGDDQQSDARERQSDRQRLVHAGRYGWIVRTSVCLKRRRRTMSVTSSTSTFSTVSAACLAMLVTTR